MTYASLDIASSIKLVMSNLDERYPTGLGVKGNAVAKLGVELGHELARSLHASGIDELTDNLANFWVSNDLGSMKFSGSKLPLIVIRGCYDCIGREQDARIHACAFKKAILETVLSDVLKQQTRLRETSCCRNEGNGCVFEVRGFQPPA